MDGVRRTAACLGGDAVRMLPGRIGAGEPRDGETRSWSRSVRSCDCSQEILGNPGVSQHVGFRLTVSNHVNRTVHSNEHDRWLRRSVRM